MGLKEMIVRAKERIVGSRRQMKLPEVKMPEAKMPEVKLPEAKMPEVHISDETAEVAKAIQERFGITEEEAMERWNTIEEWANRCFDETKKMVEKIADALKPVIEAYMNLMRQEDKWQQAKREIPNNKRRMKKMPMIRRQAHLRNIRNGKKDKKQRKRR